MENLTELENMCRSYALKYEDKGNGHIQISGHGCMVNYYPLSKRRTVYCNGVTTKDCSFFDAIKICQQNGATNIKVKNKNISKSVARGSFKTQKTESVVKHLYSGDTPPWEYPTRIMCWSDIYRIEAQKLLDMAMVVDSPACYEDAIID